MANDTDLTEDDKIVDEAKKRFKRCQRHEAVARKRYIEDIKFANGDARNMYQWPDEARQGRTDDGKPCFTINKTRVHCLQIINDARQNKQAINIKPTGGDATYESAQIYQGLIRHIEYQSSAQNVYTTATRTQVEGGIGYWRVVTDYISDDSFDQEIFIRRIKNPLSVYLDPNCNEADRSDAEYGFVFDKMPIDEAEKKWPELKDHFPKTALGAANEDDWVDQDDCRVAEYFRRISEPDEMVAVDLDGKRVIEHLSKLAASEEFQGMKPKFIRQKLAEAGAQFRKVVNKRVEWYKIAGDTIVERQVDYPGKYIPIVMLIGEETTIDGEMDRKGHTRALIDPQRNLNYWTSEGAAQVALQTKVPFVGPARAFEGHEEDWKNANRKNLAYLVYNDVEDDGTAIPDARPQRTEPPVLAAAYLQGMQFSEDQMRMVSGQYQASIGAPGNETSGVAIQQRQRQADNATYHYVDHLANAIRYTGRIIIDLIPKVYDTQRVVKIMAENGDITEALLDPKAGQAYIEGEKKENEEIRAIFNPNVGKYDVEADVGPAFATQRQEAFNAISEIIRNAPNLMMIVGDLLMKSADFPLADEMAQRLKKGIPPQFLDDGPNPQVQQLQQQAQTMQQLAHALTQKVAELQSELKAKQDKISVEAYRAETDRLNALEKALAIDPEGLVTLIKQTIAEAVGTAPQQVAPQPEPMPPAPPATPQPPPDGNMQPDQPQPPSGGFSMPEPQEPQQ